MLHRLGYTVQVLDVSGAWKHISDLPYVSKVYKFNGQLAYGQLRGSGIYDLSLLKLSESKKVIEEIANDLWSNRVNRANNNHLFLFYEEAEGTLRNIRGDTSEAMFRLVHVGRNKPINLRCILLTVDLALIDPSVIRQCGIRFYGFINPEENSKRKFRSYHGVDWLRVVEHVETGTFVRLHKRKLDIVTVPCFERKHAPQLAFPEPTEPKPIVKPKISLWQSLKSLF